MGDCIDCQTMACVNKLGICGFRKVSLSSTIKGDSGLVVDIFRYFLLCVGCRV